MLKKSDKQLSMVGVVAEELVEEEEVEEVEEVVEDAGKEEVEITKMSISIFLW